MCLAKVTVARTGDGGVDEREEIIFISKIFYLVEKLLTRHEAPWEN